MAWMIQTTNGSAVPTISGKAYETEEQAKARCDKANAEAEALGIKTRYEVVDREWEK